MNEILALLVILVTHWLADFVLQSDNIAKNKSKSIKILLTHGFQYSLVWGICLFLLLLPRLDKEAIIFISAFVSITVITHSVVDFFTSKINSFLLSKGKTHEFFIVVGLDQILHYIQLYLTFKLLI